MKTQSWNVTDEEGNSYKIQIDKKNISINEKTQPLKQLEKYAVGEFVSAYKIPTGSKKTVIYTPSVRKGENWDLVVDGIDVVTGETYEPCAVEKWSYIFPILYLANLKLFIGGAVGGAILGGFGFLSVYISMIKRIPRVTRILIDVLMYVIVSGIEFGIIWLMLTK